MTTKQTLEIKHTGENVVKQKTKIDTPKNLEARITAALTSTDIRSTDLESCCRRLKTPFPMLQ
jgi:hypothetical protein